METHKLYICNKIIKQFNCPGFACISFSYCKSTFEIIQQKLFTLPSIVLWIITVQLAFTSPPPSKRPDHFVSPPPHTSITDLDVLTLQF